MKIEIELDEVDILETYESYDHEGPTKPHRRWGRMSWLYPGDIVVQVSGKSAREIKGGEPDAT
jgi:hypothetical protein